MCAVLLNEQQSEETQYINQKEGSLITSLILVNMMWTFQLDALVIPGNFLSSQEDVQRKTIWLVYSSRIDTQLHSLSPLPILSHERLMPPRNRIRGHQQATTCDDSLCC